MYKHVKYKYMMMDIIFQYMLCYEFELDNEHSLTSKDNKGLNTNYFNVIIVEDRV